MVEKYDVALQHTVYIFPLLVILVTRAQSLTEVEVARLSALTVFRLAHAREQLLRKPTLTLWIRETGRLVEVEKRCGEEHRVRHLADSKVTVSKEHRLEYRAW